MGPMDYEPAFWNGTTSDIHFPTPWTVYPGTNELGWMGDAVLADPQAQEQLPVAALDLETFESAPRPDIFPGQDHAQSMSLDEGWLKLIDGWVAGQQVQPLNYAPNTGTPSSLQQKKRKCEEVKRDVAPRQIEFPTTQNHLPSMSMDDGIAIIDAWMARRQVQGCNDALDSGTSSYSQKNKPKHEEVERDVAPRQIEFPTQNHLPSMSMDKGIAIVDAWMARQQVQASNDALDSGTSSYSNKRKHEEVERDVAPRQVKFPRHEQRDHSDKDPVWRNADSQGQTSLTISQGELACRAAVAGSQTPGITVNGVTLRRPQLKLPSDNHGATASGSHPQKILNEVSAGANLMVARKAASSICCGIKRLTQTSKPNVASKGQKADKSARVFTCDACKRADGSPMTFKTERNLQKHLSKTKKHGAPPVLRCSKCHVTVVREDAMGSHHKTCPGTAVPV